MASHAVVILGNRRPASAIPGMLLGDASDTVRFDARGTDVQIKFWRWPFREVEDLIRVSSRVPSKPYTLRDYEEEVDEYPYTVFCSSTGDRAVGGSEPGIIIRRP